MLKTAIVSMPFNRVDFPSIQLVTLSRYLRCNGLQVDEHHLYLDASEIYGLDLYNRFFYSSEYLGQLGFSVLLFSEDEALRHRALEFYNNKLSRLLGDDAVSFDEYLRRTRIISDRCVDKLKGYDLVGFSCTYSQLIPSLLVAKRLKLFNPEVKIVLGGSYVMGEKGRRVMDAFDFVDYTVDGRGEKPLLSLILGREPWTVPGLSYRMMGEICYYKAERCDRLTNKPVDYDQFFAQLNASSEALREYFRVYGWLLVELNHGCCWHKCDFCGLGTIGETYYERDDDEVFDEIMYLSDKYNWLKFYFTGNHLSFNHRDLFRRLIKTNRDFYLFAEIRADMHLSREDYCLMRLAGVNDVQSGVETFDPVLLQRMNKGLRVIENLACLKFCAEYDINNVYNIITGYTNEYSAEMRMKELIEQVYDKPYISRLRVSYGSKLSESKFFCYESLDKLLYPRGILGKDFILNYDIKRCKEEKKMIKALKKWKPRMKDVLFYRDGGKFLTVYDNRGNKNTVFTLNADERKVLLSCDDAVESYEAMLVATGIEKEKLNMILDVLIREGFLFQEDNLFFSLVCKKTVWERPMAQQKKVIECPECHRGFIPQGMSQ